MPQPTVLFHPASAARLKKGFDTLAQVLALTLGPARGHVLSTSATKPQPELLTDAATIARRVIELPERSEDVGAMVLRNMVWRTHQRVGDGGATTAVLGQALLDQATRYVAAGANAVALQRGLKHAAAAAAAALQEMAQPAQGAADLAGVAPAVTGQPELALLLGEMFDLLGPHAYITVEDYTAPYLERVYLDGGRWEARLVSPYLITAPETRRAIQPECRVALFFGNISTVDEVKPLLTLAAQETTAPLLLVAQQISGAALTALTATHQQGQIKIIAAALKRVGDRAHHDFADLALLTGAQLLGPELGRALPAITAADLGQARRAEAGAEDLFVVGGRGAASAVRAQIEILHRRQRALPCTETEARAELRLRLARFNGSAAVLKIGALTQVGREALHQRADQGIKALTATLEEGLVPGGGLAYIQCRAAVQKLLPAQADADAALGVKVVLHALEAPFRCILRNAHIETPGVILEEIRRRGGAYVYDVMRKEIVPAQPAGLRDPAKVLRIALETAASGAMMLSTAAVVLKRRPQVSYEP